MNATTSFDYTDFYIVVPAEALETAVQTLADMAFRSTFAPVEVDRERQVILDRRTNARQAWSLASLEVAGVGYEYLERYTTQVRSATARDVQRAAGSYLSTLRTVVAEPPPK